MRLHIFVGVLATLLVSGCAVAQPGKADDEHSAHHPPGSATAPTTTQPAAASQPAPAAEGFHRQMKAMQEMHQKMQAADTPAARAALMDEHMQLMQSGMAMMGQMRGPGPAGPGGGMPGMGGAGPGDMGMKPRGGQARHGNSPATGAGMAGMPGMMGMHMQLEQRIAVMEQMMQMMVDREAAMPRR